MYSVHVSVIEPFRHEHSPGVWFGGDYNPEQWPLTVLDEDMRLMRQAHVNTATVGVFSWSSLEPESGRYEFGWLDEAMDRLHASGVRVILATPTASPPPWFTRLNPEALPVTADGVRLIHGSRDTYNPAAPAYRDAAVRITRALAERYGEHPALAMWHLHNEYGTVTYGPVTDAAFRTWLAGRYGDLTALNRAWNTAFWSQGYTDWRDIHAPQATQYLANPSHVLDFKRFSADLLLECLRDQATVVRELTPHVPTTTNFMLPTWNHYDQWAFAREIDVVSIDHYLDDAGPAGETHVAFGADLARSFAGGRPWLLMEQSTSLVYDYVGGRMLPKEPGRMRRNTYQYLARGAMGSLFFQWRSPLVGAEFFHSAMVPHAGPDSRIFRELAALGAELESIAEAVKDPDEGPVVETRVAIVWSADAWWAAQTPAMPSNDVEFLPAVRAVHTALWELGVVTDVVSPDEDLARYDVILVPSLLAVSDQQADAFARFVDGGGHLAVWHFAGSTDEHLRVRQGSYSAAFASLAGIRVEEHVPLVPGGSVTLSDGAQGSSWTELLHLNGAEAMATYTGDAHPVIGAGSPAVTRRILPGGGRVHYLSTRLAGADLRSFAARVLAEAHVPTAGFDGVEVVRRRAGSSSYLFVINHGRATATVPAEGTNLLGSRPVTGTLTLAAGDVAVVRESRTDGDAS